jgi:ubiquinol-cytochrome c reductase cytochrome b subunit
VLGVVGANAPEGNWIIIGRLATFYYFFHFLVILPVVGWIESPKPLPDSISTSVLGDKKPVAEPAE